jgi:uncharacterized protein YndB with AHSA1/START domain/class 3 adenylate cyclase
MDSVQQGYIVLADISGYTTFTATTELTHSQEILKELLDTIIATVDPVFEVVEVEGDAVFAYGPREGITRIETILETVEKTYGYFIRKRDSVRIATTCQCNACRKIPTLDLKFIMHYGEYAMQEFHGKERPFGLDVNIAHRLLKNSVSEKTGWRGYALFSDAAAENLGIEDADHVLTLTEPFEHVGEITTRSFSLLEMYERFKRENRVLLDDDSADVHITHEYPVSPAKMWEWIVEPEKRMMWMEGRHWSKGKREGDGRTRIGSQNHCAHGKGAVVETIVDWEPFEYMTSVQVEGKMKVTQTILLHPTENGTLLHNYLNMALPLPKAVRRMICTFMMKKGFNIPKMMQKLEELVVA